MNRMFQEYAAGLKIGQEERKHITHVQGRKQRVDQGRGNYPFIITLLVPIFDCSKKVIS
jgi:hypothetical protein